MKKFMTIVLAITMVLTFVGCSSIKETSTISGIVTSINDKSIQIETEDKSPYVIHLNNATYKKGASNKFEVGNLVEIKFSGEVMESYPMQINAISIIKNENTK